MASSGQYINRSNISSTFQSYTKTFYNTDQGFYVRADSWGMLATVNSAFLNDWHGDCEICHWDEYGWSRDFINYMQDTNSRKTSGAIVNAPNLPVSSSNLFHVNYPEGPEYSLRNLWRIRFIHDQWGGNYGLTVTFYIGSANTCPSGLYNDYLYHNYIYSNGTVGQSQCGLWSYGNGWASNDQEVLNYFASNRGTKIFAQYDRHCVSALRQTY